MSDTVGISISEHFQIGDEWLEAQGIFNATLDIDSPLFIDPFLLPESKHKEFSDCGFSTYEQHFGEIHWLLCACQIDDKIWKSALKKFQFSEAKGLNGTCLGYSKKSTKGRAFGKKLSKQALKWAKEVVDLGVKDPDLFSCMSLFEEGIGPDRISDMVTNIILECIIQFNYRILAEMEIELENKITRSSFELRNLKVDLPRNPYSNTPTPIILLPSDILKHLPIVNDATKLSDAALHNENLRNKVNSHISEIFKIRTKQEKNSIKERAMSDAAAFQTLLDLIKITEKTPYNLFKDPEGLIQWRPLARTFSSIHKLNLVDNPSLTRVDRIDNVVVQILNQFQHLVEDCRLAQSFYVDGEPRHERFAQLLFYAIAVSYCAANDLGISPEADAGAGPVDFKFSDGSDSVIVEIKLSTNSKIVEGYKKQLAAYAAAEKSSLGHYVVIDVGRIGHKWDRLSEIHKKSEFGKTRRIHLIDGTPRNSASKL